MMKNVILLFVSILLLTFYSGCSQKLPENYGVYIFADKGMLSMQGQQINFRGNLFQSITGVKGSSGLVVKSVKDFIVYEKDINPRIVRLAKLDFKKAGSVANIIGKTNVDVQLWVKVESIGLDIAPITGKKDMYRLTPKRKLAEGFYALHFGGLENMATIEASMGSFTYDFVIGNRNKYLSQEDLKKQQEAIVQMEAENLLREFNRVFNDKDYSKINAIYRPSCKTLSESEWQEFTKGLSAWLNEAGKISQSTVIGCNVNNEEGIFQVQTEYTKKGQQIEKLVIKKINGKYFITALE